MTLRQTVSRYLLVRFLCGENNNYEYCPVAVVFVEFSQASFVVSEEYGSTMVCVVLTGALEREVAIQLVTDDNVSIPGTFPALSFVDYQPLFTHVLFNQSGEQCRTLNVFNDSSLENNESIILRISSNDSAVNISAELGRSEVVILDSNRKLLTIFDCTLF